jgi:hypothetical protein
MSVAMKNKMNLLLVVVLFISAVSCSDKRSAEQILKDPEQQEEVLALVANDSSLLTKLHSKMNGDNKTNMNANNSMMRSCMAMMDDPEMMSMMMDNMMMRCEKDSAMCSMMCDKMMNSKNMRSMIQERMHQDMKMGKDKK